MCPVSSRSNLHSVQEIEEMKVNLFVVQVLKTVSFMHKLFLCINNTDLHSAQVVKADQY